jgi:hypothetical protein
MSYVITLVVVIFMFLTIALCKKNRDDIGIDFEFNLFHFLRFKLKFKSNKPNCTKDNTNA